MKKGELSNVVIEKTIEKCTFLMAKNKNKSVLYGN